MKGLCVIPCLVLAACATGERLVGSPASSLAACPSGTALLTVPPIALADIGGWVPLGSVNAPAHTFPTDHQYLYLTSFNSPVKREVDLVAPANIVITRARRTTYSNDGHTDYAASFSPCRETAGEFGHIATIATGVLSKLGAFDQQCESYSPNPGLSVTTCYTRQLAVSMTAGESLGTVGDANVASLDFTFWDTRVTRLRYANPSRWITSADGFDNFHVVAGSDYFAEPARSQIAAKVGSFDGRTRRTATPIGGTIELDVPGTAQGAWFNGSQPTHPEGPHLAIVPDAIDPTQIDISMGLSQPGLGSGQYRVTPASAGIVNRHPAEIVPNGQVHCYELQSRGVLLLQMLDVSALRVEARPTATSCASQQPLAFNTAATFDYKR
jgi:hypothetical protein